MYSKKIIDHFQNPKYAGEMKDADVVGEAGNMKCGDVLKFFLKIEKNVIVDIRFQTYGCIAAIAATDILCGIVKGKTLDEAMKIESKDLIKESGEMPPIKHHCSVLGILALRKAIEEYRERI